MTKGFGELARRAKSGAERKAAHDYSKRLVYRRQCENPPRRRKYEKDTPAWLRFYMGPAAFPAKWSDSHVEIIENAEFAAMNGTGATVAAPRGDGKTTVLRGMAVNLVARGIVKFAVLAGWIKSQADEAFVRWLQMLADSPQFAADYPEFTQPFEITTHNTALKSLVWQDTETKIGAAIRTMHKIVVLPDSLGAIAARSVQGDVKGLNATMLDGTILRPDLLILDDAQDPTQAENPKAVAKTVDVIENVFMGMAGPTKRLTTFCACTVEAEGDVSCHFLERPGWKSLRVSRISAWPKDFQEKDSTARQLWEDWNSLRLTHGEKKALAFYRKNKKALTDGMTVSWPERYDKGRGEPDAMYSAMWEYYDKGPDVFARAQQNQPLAQGSSVYDLTPRIIVERTDTYRKAYEVPDWVATDVHGNPIIMASSDINHYGIHSVAVGFGADQSAAVLWYDCYNRVSVPHNAPEPERRRIVFEMLVNTSKQIVGLSCRPHTWLIDGGYEHETVQRFVMGPGRKLGIRVLVARGYAADRYRPYGKNVIGEPREQCHATQWPLGKGLAWNADYWREISQRGWLGSIGAPGSCSLFSGHHKEFAEQICREKLIEKVAGKTGMFYKWHQTPGWHDYGDCMGMVYAGAAWKGIGSSGIRKVQRRYKETRKAKPIT
jgi:hypothetical protein